METGIGARNGKKGVRRALFCLSLPSHGFGWNGKKEMSADTWERLVTRSALRAAAVLTAANKEGDGPEWHFVKTVNRRDFHGFKRGSRYGDARPAGEALHGFGCRATHRQQAGTERQGLLTRRTFRANSGQGQRPRLIPAQGSALGVRRRLREP